MRRREGESVEIVFVEEGIDDFFLSSVFHRRKISRVIKSECSRGRKSE